MDGVPDRVSRIQFPGRHAQPPPQARTGSSTELWYRDTALPWKRNAPFSLLPLAHCNVSPRYRKTVYWKFNVRLLQDAAFCSSFSAFWAKWSGRKADFDSLRQWWDVGKAQITNYNFCQQYTSYATKEKQRIIAALERDIARLEQQIGGRDCDGVQAELEELRRDMGAFLLDRAKGALVRARFQLLREMDAPSSFFFNLEKQYNESKQIYALYMSDGRLSSDVREIQDRTVEFYSDLYKAEKCDNDCVDTLLADLPKLALDNKDMLDLPLTLEELKTAVFQMSPGRAPGIDGLPVEFYKTFWDHIGQDLLSVLSQHWLKVAVLYLPTHEGGQGLIDLESRVAAFRLKAAQRLNAWKLLKATRAEGIEPTAWVWEEPIFHNQLIPIRSVRSTTLRRSFLNAGICKMGHLRMSDGTGWKTAQILAQQTGINSQRLLEQFLGEVQQALSQQVQELLELPQRDVAPEFPSMRVATADGGWQENRGTLLTFSSPSIRLFEDTDGKALYTVCVKVKNLRALTEVREHCWHDLLGGQSMAGFRWRVLYKLPVPKRSGDLQWRIIHGAIATNQHTAHFVQGVDTTCPFFFEPETVEHLFVQCSRLNILFGALHRLCMKLNMTFTYGLFILGPKYTRSQRARCCLLNFVFGQAKLAIWLTRRNKLRGRGLTDPDEMLRSFIRARVKVDFAYYKAMNDLLTFRNTWCVGEALGCVEDGELTVCV
ncbi:hypothetical protein MHYP_G00264700 [Metynnis hypsauchen]